MKFLHNLTYRARALIERLGYKKAVVLRFAQSDAPDIETKALQILLPNDWYGVKINVDKPKKLQLQIAEGLLPFGVMRIVYQAQAGVKSVYNSGVDPRFIDLALNVHAEFMIEKLFVDRESDQQQARWNKRLTLVKRAKRNHLLPDLLNALEGARQEGNTLEELYLITAICHLYSKSNRFVMKKKLSYGGKEYTIIVDKAQARFLGLYKSLIKPNKLGQPSNMKRLADVLPVIVNMLPIDPVDQDDDADADDTAIADASTSDYGIDNLMTFISDDSDDEIHQHIEQSSEITERDDLEENGYTARDHTDESIDEYEPLNELEIVTRGIDDYLAMHYNNKTWAKLRGAPIQSAVTLSRQIKVELDDSARVVRRTGIITKVKMLKAITEPSHDERTFYKDVVIHEPGHKRDVVICVDISSSMAYLGRIQVAMSTAQAIAIAVKQTGGLVGGVLFNALGHTDSKVSDDVLFRKDPYTVSGSTSLQFLSELWLTKPNAKVVVITDGEAELPVNIKPEDRERTYVICLGSGFVKTMEPLGNTRELTVLKDLPKLLTEIVKNQ